MAPTGANIHSSRSHSILIFNIESRDRNKNIKDTVLLSKL